MLKLAAEGARDSAFARAHREDDRGPRTYQGAGPSNRAAVVNSLRFVEALSVIGRKVTWQAREIAGGSFMLHHIAVIEFDGGMCLIEQRNVHDSKVVQMSKKLVSIATHLIDIPIEFRLTDAEFAQQIGFEASWIGDDRRPEVIAVPVA